MCVHGEVGLQVSWSAAFVFITVSEHGHVTNNAFRCLHGECVSVCLCAVDSKDLCAYLQGVQKDA